MSAGDPDSLKALYRRGQAFQGDRQWELAVTDLGRAAKLSANDPAQLHLIKQKLQVGRKRKEIWVGRREGGGIGGEGMSCMRKWPSVLRGTALRQHLW